MRKFIGLTLVCVIGIFLGSVASNLHRVHKARNNERASVQEKLGIYSNDYTSSGVAGLSISLSKESSWARESSFVEVLNPSGSVKFFHAPGTQAEASTLKLVGTHAQLNPAWLNLPSSNRGMIWTIGCSTLPDGSRLYVGLLHPDFRFM
jgi:hypothetical protein